jgi:hypothetical protein
MQHKKITITILDIMHRPVFHLKYDISETGFCFCLLVEPTQLDPIDRVSPSFRGQRLALSIGSN